MTSATVIPNATPVTPVMPVMPGVGNWLHLIQAEYREMPCLSLTKAQMQRLWGLEAYVCDALVDALVAARILRRNAAGAYVAVSAGR